MSEGVECYLDLLAALQSEDQHGVRANMLTYHFQEVMNEIVFLKSVNLHVYGLRFMLRSPPSPSYLDSTSRLELPY